METQARPLAIVTGASSGIGLALAKCCVDHGFDLVIAADEPQIHEAAASLRRDDASIDAVQADLATLQGVDRVHQAVLGRPVAALIANAGRGLGRAFLDQDFEQVRRVIDTNVTGTLYLVHRVGREMRDRRAGRIMITGSIAGLIPGSYQAVYNGTKALLDSFSEGLRDELKETGVTVTSLMPGPTDTEFFARAGMLDTPIGKQKKQSADEVARRGFEAMMRGEHAVVTGWQNKLQAAVSRVAPRKALAALHRRKAAPQPQSPSA